MGADYPALRNLSQAPSCRDAFRLRHSIASVRSGAHDHRIWPPVQRAKAWVITTVKKAFHAAADGREVFGEREQISLRRYNLCSAHICCVDHLDVDTLRTAGTIIGSAGQRLGPARHTVPDYQQLPHRCLLAPLVRHREAG